MLFMIEPQKDPVFRKVLLAVFEAILYQGGCGTMWKRCEKWYLGWAVAGLLVLLCTTSAYGSESRFGYKIGPRDIIAVSIFAGGEEQVNVDLTVSEAGNVNFPFLGNIKAQGLAVNELEKQVATALANDFFVNPQVHIRVREYHSLHFSISGAVRSPGKLQDGECHYGHGSYCQGRRSHRG
jgi:hypothetical protein